MTNRKPLNLTKEELSEHLGAVLDNPVLKKKTDKEDDVEMVQLKNGVTRKKRKAVYTKPLPLLLDEETHEKFLRICARMGIPPSTAGRMAVVAWIDRNG